jgi:hypothetical protein
LLLGACATAGYTYVKSPDNMAFFKIPSRWTLYNKEQILVAEGQSLSPAAGQTFSWLVGFDASPQASINHLFQGVPTYPAVRAEVQNMDPQERDTMSLAGIRNSVYPLDQLVQANQAEILRTKDLVRPGGFYGSQIDYDVTLGGIAHASQPNLVMRVIQVGLLDPGAHKLYLFYVRCDSHCFRDNQRLIDQIVGSWTVKER